jgi:hypothetical protein
MTFTHKIVHANGRDEIWVQNKTSNTLNPESNDPVTAKAVVEYVEDKMAGVGGGSSIQVSETVSYVFDEEGTQQQITGVEKPSKYTTEVDVETAVNKVTVYQAGEYLDADESKLETEEAYSMPNTDFGLNLCRNRLRTVGIH